MSRNRPYNKWQVSRHACEMWVLRIEDHLNSWQARHRILVVMPNAIRVPNRLAGSRWVRKWQKEADKKFRQRGTRYYFHPNAVLIIGSKTHVVTVQAVDNTDLATVLVWLLTGFWVNKDEDGV